MKKEGKIRSFSKRITLWIALTQLIVMGLAAYGIYRIAKNFIIMEETDLYKSYATTTQVQVSKILDGVSAGADNRVSEIEANLADPDKMGSIMERMVAQNPYVHSCGLSFVANYYPRMGRWFCPYAFRDSTGVRQQRVIRDYLSEDWFVEALKADSSYWSKPFFEHNDTLNPLVSYLVPIHDAKGTTVGVLGVDISLAWFSKRLMADIKLMGDSVVVEKDSSKSNGGLDHRFRFVYISFIIDGDGTFIAHPDTSLVLKKNYFELAKMTNDTIDDHMGRQMVTGHRGTYEGENDGRPKAFPLFDDDGLDVYLFYEPVESTGWSVAMVVPWLMIDGIGITAGIAMALMIGLALVVVRFVGNIVIRRITKPVKLLAESANEVAKGNFNAPLPKIKHNDEIRLLRDSFEGMQHSLTTYMEELKATTAEKASIENELKIAHNIQMSMLPKTFPPYPERSDIDIFGSLTPAKDVGGDLFDFYIRDERLFFCIGDVSGKGVPASLVMATTRSLFRNISSHVSNPGSIVKAINDVQAEGNEATMFVTLFVGVLDLADGRLHYCNAGHNPPMVISRQVSYLPCEPNVPVGLMSGLDFIIQETALRPGETIFLYTDGLNEAEDSAHAQFGEERMEKVANSLLADGDAKPKEIVERMSEAVRRFVDDAEQSDDLTMLAITYTK